MLVAYLSVLLLVNAAPVQRWLAERAEQLLEQKIGSEVSIGRLEIGLFNRVVLHDVEVKDKQNERLLGAGLMSAKIAYSPLLDGRVVLRSVSLLDAQINAYKVAPDSAANFQFFLDAFKGEDDGKPSHLNLTLGSVIVRRTQLAYAERYKARKSGGFDASHMKFEEIDASISLKALTPDSISVRVRHLALRERSGLDVKHLSFILNASKKRAKLSRFDLRLPESELSQSLLTATYDLSSGKSLLSTLQLQGSVNGASVALADLSAFVPQLGKNAAKFRASADYSLSRGDLALTNVSITEAREHLALAGSARVLTTDGKIRTVVAQLPHIFVDAPETALLLGGIVDQSLLEKFQRLGRVDASVELRHSSANVSHLVFDVTSAVGRASGNVSYEGENYRGKFDASDVEVARLLGSTALPERVSLSGEGEIQRSGQRIVAGKGAMNVSELAYGGYAYHDVNLNAKLAGKSLALTLESADPNARLSLDATALFDGSTLSDIIANLSVSNLNTTALNLNTPLEAAQYAGHFRLDASTLSLQTPRAALQISDFSKRSFGDGSSDYSLSHLALDIRQQGGSARAHLSSDFAEAEFEGPLSPAHLLAAAKQLVGKALPEVFPASASAAVGEEWRVKGALLKSDFFNQMLGLSVAFPQPVTFEGHLSGNAERSYMSFSAPQLSVAGQDLSQLRGMLRGGEGRMGALIQAKKHVGESEMSLALEANAADGVLESSLAWGGANERSYSGELKATTQFARGTQGALNVSAQILPTTVFIADSLWQVGRGQINYIDGNLDVASVGLERAGQAVKVNGRLSKNPADSIKVSLQNADIAYILELVKLNPVKFSGLATGEAYAAPTPSGLSVGGKIRVPDFCFNEGYMGDSQIEGHFSSADKRLYLKADMQEAGVGSTQVDGYVGIGEKGLDLHVQSRNTTLHFLRRYIGYLFGDISGRTTGNCRIFGPFKAIGFEGEEDVSLNTTVLSTGSNYHLTAGHVSMTSGAFRFSQFQLADNHGGSGIADGYILHDNLKNFRYDVRVAAQRLELYNKGRSSEMSFYATAYGTGAAHLYGSPGRFNADLDMEANAGTVITYLVNNPASGYDASLLRFGNKHDELIGTVDPALLSDAEAFDDEPQEATTDIRLNFQVSMRPEATLRVIMDEKTGDNIELNGTGRLRSTFYNKGNFQIFGIYNVTGGWYRMAIQEVIQKHFRFRDGGTITFGGDPYEGDLNLEAVYTVPSVTLSDLGLRFSEKSLRADCILNLGGKVREPQVTFDLTLPGASEEVRQMVQQYIATEEDRNMQVLYLLGVGRFYNYAFDETDASAGGQSQTSVAMKSLLSNTLSTQLNNIISNAVGASNWTFGANVQTGQVGWSDMEVGGLFTGRMFDNRLTVNGNIGYRERTTSTANFVGDFDINYRLTPSGSVNLKAYSETNDRYFSKSAITTQGIGIVVKRSFTRFFDLFRRKNKAK